MKLILLEKYRCKKGFFGSSEGDRFGLFFIDRKLSDIPLRVICSPFDGKDQWEHISVSLPNRTPTWSEMCRVKNFFWAEDITVIQFHPKKSEYVNNYPHCLHMWRDTTIPEHELPPSMLTGIKEVNEN